MSIHGYAMLVDSTYPILIFNAVSYSLRSLEIANTERNGTVTQLS